jgi:hypothetical protein
MTDNPAGASTEETDAGTATATQPTPTEETASAEREERRQSGYHPPQQESFDWRGWLLVGCIVVSFLVIPGVILYLPYAQGAVTNLGLSWTQAYLVLPMIPAILLGAIAIWAAVGSR